MNTKNYEMLKRYFYIDGEKCKKYIIIGKVFINNSERLDRKLKVQTNFSNMDSLYTFIDDPDSITDASKTIKCICYSNKGGSIIIRDEKIAVEDIGEKEYKKIKNHFYARFYIEYKDEIYLLKQERDLWTEKSTNVQLIYIGKVTTELKEKIINKEEYFKEYNEKENDTLENLKKFLNEDSLKYKNEIITDNDYEKIKNYFLGENKYFTIFKLYNVECYVGNMCQMPNDTTLFNITNGKCFFNDLNSVNDASCEMKYLFSDYDSNYHYMYIKYKNKAYKITIGRGVDYNNFFAKNVELIYEPKGKEGKKVLYDSNGDGIKEDWFILYDDGENIEIISENVLGELRLNPNISNSKTYSINDNEDLKNECSTYNNLIKIINDYCKKIITSENDKDKIRSIGSAIDYSSEYEEYYNGNLKIPLKSGDRLYEQDIVRLIFWNIGFGKKIENYFLASRYSGNATRGTWMANGKVIGAEQSFNARIISDIDYYGLVGDDTMLVEIYKNEIVTFTQIAGVRPIVKNPTEYELE